MVEMTLTETLFGGFLVTVLIFSLTKKMGLASFWSGILSVVTPFVGYLYHVHSNWPTGDVLAIHFVVYLAAATVMMVFWKERANKEKMHWAPKLMITFFILLVIFMAMFVSLASQGVSSSLGKLFLPNSADKTIHTAFPGVIPHDNNKLYETYVKEVEQQQARGWSVEVKGMDNIQLNVPSELTIRLIDKNQRPIHGANITIHFWRMAKSADDTQVVFSEVSNGVYHAKVSLQDPGLWVTTLEIQSGDEKYVGKQSIQVKSN